MAGLLGAAGLPIVDADKIARTVVEPGQPALGDLVDAFGEAILEPTGRLNRAELARRAFASTAGTQTLNAITHPRIRAEANRQFAEAEARGADAAVYDMPLLVELGADKEMDLVIVVDVAPEIRVARLVEHRGLDAEDARRRIAAQIDDAARRAAADIVIDNSGSLEDLTAQVDGVLARIAAL
ncbi:dephospho-CoA kinase [Corynebacterium uterequi]|uniref:Dephospho-CoA kinase n=1 Tax=Corynebacterium uterequi TaxID=1072256 RepID=A0A0G3HCG1_9CORY|nr:dephospho-CoA kinase [Corynebacterium uterequi]